MVRIFSCHHFKGQRIGRCEEAVGVVVAGNAIIIAHESQISIYGTVKSKPVLSPEEEHPVPGPSSSSKEVSSMSWKNYDLGTTFVYPKSDRGLKTSTAKPQQQTKGESPQFEESDLKLSHSFGTVDSVQHISYNERGRYLLCLEKRDSTHSATNGVRAYFNWEQDHGMKPLRARIAGLVSPGSEPETQDSLLMIEIPLTSPATAVSSCNLTGHLACVSAESIINIFLFRTKEATGRVRVPYYDFDRTYAIETTGFVPDRILFMANYMVCMNHQKIHVIGIHKEGHHHPGPQPHATAPPPHEEDKNCEKIVFDPKNETVKVFLPSIVRANRKRKYSNAVITEEYEDEIPVEHRTKVIFSALTPGIVIQDVLRVTENSSGSNPAAFVDTGLFPIRFNDHLGSVALLISSAKEAYLYHLPCVAHGTVVRTCTYPFTTPVLSVSFDSVFLHVLTEGGLASYTSRNLYNVIKDWEGLRKPYNDCPLDEEVPSLVGIHPFANLQKMACNTEVLCVLTSPTPTNPGNNNKTPSQQRGSGGGSQEDRNWTIYALDLPDIEVILDDIVRTAKLQTETNPEASFTLLCEGFIALRLYQLSHPGSSAEALNMRFRDICKQIGLALLKTAAGVDQSSTLGPKENSELVDKGVSYLLMGRCGVQDIFSPENWAWMREPLYVQGFVRLIEVTLLRPPEKNLYPDLQKLSPTLAPVLVEYLANNSPHTLVELVIHSPFIRECNSKRLLHILLQLAESSNYARKEVLALLLTYVTVGGVEANTRSQIKELLHKADLCGVASELSLDLLLESRGQQYFLTDLAVCLIAAEESRDMVIDTITGFLKTGSKTVAAIMNAFAQALNANTDIHLQHDITRSLTRIVEVHIVDKLKRLSCDEDTTTESYFVEDERAIHMLLRTYLSLINFSNDPKSQSPTDRHRQQSHSPHTPTNESDERKDDDKKNDTPQQQLRHGETELVSHNQIFGNTLTCINFLLSIDTPGGSLTPASQNVASAPIFVNEESRENFIKLLSFLSHPILSNLPGVKDIVLAYLYKNATQAKPTVNITLYFILQVLAETPEKAINLMLAKQPTTVILFARETFHKDSFKWKLLVSSLKKRVQEASSGNTNESDIASTILESVYLHLANTLTPNELEAVLDKGLDENSRFHGICKRVELANHYANMVVSVSTEFLNSN